MKDDNLREMLDMYYATMDGSPRAHAYHQRHGTESACILTITSDEDAINVAEHLRERIEGKVVVEIGAGIGLLACHLATIARKVYAIEVDPAWVSCFVAVLYARKPKNLTFIFGAADEAPPIAADVAVFCTLSGQAAMYRVATRFAPEIIDVYAEVLCLALPLPIQRGSPRGESSKGAERTMTTEQTSAEAATDPGCPDLGALIARVNHLLDDAAKTERDPAWPEDYDPEYEAQQALPQIFKTHHYESEGDRPVGTVEFGSAGFEDTPVALYRLLYLFGPKPGACGSLPKPIDFGHMYKSESLFSICSPDYTFQADPQFHKYELSLSFGATPEHLEGSERFFVCGVPGSDDGIRAKTPLLKDWTALLLRCLNRKWMVYSGNNFEV